VLGVLFGAVAPLGQPPPPPPPPRDDSPATIRTGTIRGRVVAAATGDPIRNARIALNDDARVVAVLTDRDGRFALTSVPKEMFPARNATFTLRGLPPGDYYVAAIDRRSAWVRLVSCRTRRSWNRSSRTRRE
jgi:hypothetical protein